MIKLLLSGKQILLFIIIAWSLLAFVSYNVLTAEATTEQEKDCSSISEPDDDFYCKQFDWGAYHPDKQSVDELCDASEDYAKNPKHCDIAYGLVEKQDKNLKKDLEEACEKAGGKMEDGYCDVKESEKAEAEKEEPPVVIEDWGNTVVSDADAEYQRQQEYQQEKHEQLSQSTPIPDFEPEEEEEDEPEEEEEDEPEEEEDDNSNSESEE